MARLMFLLMWGLIVSRWEASAQGLQVEGQAGIGYVHDSGEGPSAPAASAAAIVWVSPVVGFGVRGVFGLRDDRYDPPVVDDDRTFLGPGGLRMWSAMFQLRGQSRRAELNVGIGLGGHLSDDKMVITGIRRASGTIDPIPPETHRLRYSTGGIASEMFIGVRLARAFHLKGGFTYLLSGDMHPFQPMVILSIKSR